MSASQEDEPVVGEELAELAELAEIVEHEEEAETALVQSSTLFGTDNPVEVISRASEIATALAEVVRKQKLASVISGREFVRVEGWTLLGSMLGVFPVVEWTHEVVDDEGQNLGWEARVEARTRDGQVVGAAEAECLRSEKTWKGRDSYALRSMSQCLPVRARILTRDGFKTYGELTVGEEVLAYDQQADANEWVPLEAVNVFGPEPMIRLRNRSFDFTCTPDHSWACVGEAGALKLVGARRLIGSRYRVMRSAEAPGGDHPLDERAAEVIGWLLTDGTIRYPSRGSVRCHIDQSKPAHVVRLRELLDDWAGETVYEAGTRTFPSGYTSATLQAHRFTLKAEITRMLLALGGVRSKDEVPTCLGHLSSASRRAMLRGMLAADGSGKPSEGGFEGRRWRFSKQIPAVMETFRVLATLEGMALGNLSGFTNVNGNWQPTQTLRANRVTRARWLRVEELPPEPVWCPTTRLGTWVAELDGNVSITGNSRAVSKAMRGPLGFVMTLAGFEATPSEEMPPDPDVRHDGKKPATLAETNAEWLRRMATLEVREPEAWARAAAKASGLARTPLLQRLNRVLLDLTDGEHVFDAFGEDPDGVVQAAFAAAFDGLVLEPPPLGEPEPIPGQTSLEDPHAREEGA